MFEQALGDIGAVASIVALLIGFAGGWGARSLKQRISNTQKNSSTGNSGVLVQHNNQGDNKIG
jgi:hypothetical protein